MKPSDLSDRQPVGFDASVVSTPPFSLTLHFSTAADNNKIHGVFTPDQKQKIDPNNYVVKRVLPHFQNAVDNGGFSFLRDQNDNVTTMTAAYRLHDKDDSLQNGQHHFTEIGTTMAGLAGYNSARLVIAALVLKEWLNHPPVHLMVAEIKNANLPSVKTYRDVLKWEEIPDRALNAKIFKVTDETLEDENDKTPDNKVDTVLQSARWYHNGNDALATQAKILLSFMTQGGVLNPKTNHHIPVDFKALDNVGLTAPRLGALANGETSRQAILQL